MPKKPPSIADQPLKSYAARFLDDVMFEFPCKDMQTWTIFLNRFAEVSQLEAELYMRKAVLADKLKVKRTEADQAVRRHSLEKMTETAIAASVEQLPEIATLRQQLIDAESDHKLLSFVVNIMTVKWEHMIEHILYTDVNAPKIEIKPQLVPKLTK